MFGLISTEELEGLGQLMVKQLKNRWGDTNYLKRFVIGIDRSKMKLFDAEESAQDLVDDTPVADKGNFSSRMKEEKSNDGSVLSYRKRNTEKKSNFGGFK